MLIGGFFEWYTSKMQFSTYGDNFQFITRESADSSAKLHIYNWSRGIAIWSHQNIAFIPGLDSGLGTIALASDNHFVLVRHMASTLIQTAWIKDPTNTNIWDPTGQGLYNFVAEAIHGWYLGNGIKSSYVDFENRHLGYDTNYIHSLEYEYGIIGLNHYNGEMVG